MDQTKSKQSRRSRQNQSNASELSKNGRTDDSLRNHPNNQAKSVRRVPFGQLERIKLPDFDGNHAKWLEWRALFDSLVHNNEHIGDTIKFHRLKSHLKGHAENILSGWVVTGESYMAAYNAVVHVYDNKYRIILSHLDDFYKIPVQSVESLEGLRTLIDGTNRAYRQLKLAGSPVEAWDQFWAYNLISRMAPKTRSQWETNHELKDMPTMKQVLNFLERRSNGYVNLLSRAEIYSKN